MDEQQKAFEAWFFDGVADKYCARDNEYDIAFDAWKAATKEERERCAKLIEPPKGMDAWELRCGQEGAELMSDLAAAIRKG